jgi:hypothetical protein
MGLSLKGLQASALDALVRQLDGWRTALVDTLAAPFLTPHGVYLPGVEVGTSATKVEHKLGRTPRGYLVLRIRASSPVYLIETADPDARHLTLEAGADCTVDLWVFP